MSRKRRVVTDVQRSGRVRVRVENEFGDFKTLGTFEPEEAELHAQCLRRDIAVAVEPAGPVTFAEHGAKWLDGREADGLAVIRTDRSRWRTHVARAHFFHREIATIRRADAKRFRDQLKRASISPKTQREVLLNVRAVFADALDEELIAANPFDGLKLPSGKSSKAFGWLYPDEDAALMACDDVPLAARLLYGFLVREGMRKDEALTLAWDDVDLERGIVRLDENKTDDPRAWALDPGVAQALSWWRDREESHEGRVFLGLRGRPVKTWRATQLREHLLVAGVDRSELHVTRGARVALRVHDLRATFVTLSLAAGRTETWVTDRTGHKSHSMVAKYKRAARTAAELNLGTVAPLDQAIPMIRKMIRKASNRQLEHAQAVLSAGLKPAALGHPGSTPGGATSRLAASEEILRITTRDPQELTLELLSAISERDGERAFDAALALADAADERAGRLQELAAAVRAGGDHTLTRAVELAGELDVGGLDVAADDAAGGAS